MTSDAYYMGLALAEAWKSAGHTRPNPPVGAVIVKNGKVIGRGRHKRCGGDHAEVAAIKDALRRMAAQDRKRAKPLLGNDIRHARAMFASWPRRRMYGRAHCSRRQTRSVGGGRPQSGQSRPCRPHTGKGRHKRRTVQGCFRGLSPSCFWGLSPSPGCRLAHCSFRETCHHRLAVCHREDCDVA